MTASALRWLTLAMATAVLCTAPTWAQAPDPVPTPTPAPAPPQDTQRVEITGGRATDTEQRQQSTASKIVIGRDEIERFGDSNTLEVLKRLPGVTVPGAPGRGGQPRMRGLGGGYTQILVDGERVARGFSLESIPPEQIERIEILRAPTAESGARAIAGTINIVLREGFRKKVNDLNISLQSEGGKASGGLAWTRNDSFGNWIANGSLSLFRRQSIDESEASRRDEDFATGQPVLLRDSVTRSDSRRSGLHASARLQWRGAQGQSFMLSPLIIRSDSESTAHSTQTQSLGSTPLDYSASRTLASGRFTLQRVNANYNHRPGGGPRLEWRAGASQADGRSDSSRREFDDAGALLRSIDESTDNRERNGSLSLKALQLVGEAHQLVAGMEFERNRRRDGKTTLIDGAAQLTEFGDNLQASSRRYALYGQDEWAISPQWALHAGLRVEGIATEGEGANGRIETNRSRVATPLLHMVWKRDATAHSQVRDQVRASLTRSYRAPNLSQLIGRPAVSRTDPAPGTNTELTADSAGNPQLNPEVALGLDLAVERYLAEGGVLSANLFHRRIADLIRNVVALEDVSWSPGQPRYVARPQNIGNATSQGVELEAKFRLDQLLIDGPRTDVRANASIFRSRVDAVPGPDNRLAEQPGRTLNLGADHRFRGTPLSVGGNFNHTPGYRTRLDVDRWIVQSEKNVLDTYALWTFSPDAKLRLSLSNMLEPDISSATLAQSGSLQQTNATTTRSHVNTQLRLELKL